MTAYLALGVLVVALFAMAPSDTPFHVSAAPPRPGLAPGGWTEALPDDLPFWPAPEPFDGADAPAAGGEILSFPLLSQLAAEITAPLTTRLIASVGAFRPGGLAAVTSDQILDNARGLLGVPYVWGGNSTSGLDCSAFVSRAWGVSRHTTDTLHTVGFAIGKEELRAGDALNLTTRQDPRGYGHVRLFAAWANPDHTRMWVYEETPPRAIYHEMAYDPRYTPMRRMNFAADLSAPVVAGTGASAGADRTLRTPAAPSSGRLAALTSSLEAASPAIRPGVRPREELVAAASSAPSSDSNRSSRREAPAPRVETRPAPAASKPVPAPRVETPRQPAPQPRERTRPAPTPAPRQAPPSEPARRVKPPTPAPAPPRLAEPVRSQPRPAAPRPADPVPRPSAPKPAEPRQGRAVQAPVEKDRAAKAPAPQRETRVQQPERSPAAPATGNGGASPARSGSGKKAA